MGSIPGQGTKTPHASWPSQKIKIYTTSNCEERRVHTQDIGNAFIIKRPATLNNLVYIQPALSKAQGRALPAAQWKRTCLPTQETWSDPWSGKTPGARRQVSPRGTTTEPVLESPGAQPLSPHPQLLQPTRPRACALKHETHRNEQPARHSQRAAPLTATREQAMQQQRPSTARNK